jgi:hypothetical protein
LAKLLERARRVMRMRRSWLFGLAQNFQPLSVLMAFSNATR